METRRSFLMVAAPLVAGVTCPVTASNANYLATDQRNAILRNPAAVKAIFVKLRPGFVRDLAMEDLSDPLVTAAFASVCAFYLKPYGEETNAIDLAGILAQPMTACDNYVRLTLYLMDILQPRAKTAVAVVGWDGGTIGNHAQAFVSDGAESLLLDPTIGLVARGLDYNSVASGKPCARRALRSFFSRSTWNAQMAPLHRAVTGALLDGAYRPSDALYFCTSVERFNTMPDLRTWPTPAAARLQAA